MNKFIKILTIVITLLSLYESAVIGLGSFVVVSLIRDNFWLNIICMVNILGCICLPLYSSAVLLYIFKNKEI